MQTLTTDSLAIVAAGGKVTPRIYVEPLTSAAFWLEPVDFVEGTVKIQRSWISGSVIEIGSAETSELTFYIDNEGGAFNSILFGGAVLTYYNVIGVQQLKVGKFIVDTQPKKSTTIFIAALDYMAKFNKKYSLSSLVYPATLIQILNDICDVCGVTTSITSFVNSTYVVAERPAALDLTCHLVLCFVAELAGDNAYMDEDGELCLAWYGESQGATVITNTPSTRIDYDAETEDVTLSGVAAIIGEDTYIGGTDSYAIVIEGNELLQSDYQTIVDAIAVHIGNPTFRQLDIKSYGLPHVWPGDILTITDNDGITFTALLMEHIYEANGESQLIGKCDAIIRSGYASVGAFTPRQKSVIQRVSELETEKQISSYDLAMLQLNELSMNSMGLYLTAVDDGLGGKIYYQHDAPVLEDSTVIYKQTSLGHFWTDTGWNGGSPIWTSGYSAAGNVVAKTLNVIGINANWIAANAITFDKLSTSAVTSINDLIDIGGRNRFTREGILATTPSFSFDSDGYFIPNSTTTDDRSGSYVSCSWKITLPAGTYLVTAYTDIATANANHFAGAWSSTGSALIAASWKPCLTVGKSTKSFTLASATTVGFMIKVYDAKVKVKLEAGNKSTDWTPAPEDKLSEGMSYAGVVLEAITGLTVTATISGNTISTRANATEGFAIYNGSDKTFGADSSGQVFASSLSNIDSSNYFMTYGYLTNPGLECYKPDGVGGATKFYNLSSLVEGGWAVFDINDARRMDCSAAGAFNIYDHNEKARFTLYSTGTFDIKDGSAVVLIGSDSTAPFFMDGSTKNYFKSIFPRVLATSGSSGAGGSGKWIKVAGFTFWSRYTFISTKFDVVGSPSSGGFAMTATLYFTCIQQSAFPTAPVGRLYVSNAAGIAISNADVKAIITYTASDATVVDLYVRAIHDYKSIQTFLIDEYKGGNLVYGYQMGSWIDAASLPGGTELPVLNGG